MRKGNRNWKRGRRIAWLYGAVVGAAVFLLGMMTLARLIQSGALRTAWTEPGKWGVLSLGMLVGCFTASFCTDRKVLVHTGCAGLLLLGFLLVSQIILGNGSMAGLPCAAGITCLSTLLAALLRSRSIGGRF